jgi:lipoprotein NlpD
LSQTLRAADGGFIVKHQARQKPQIVKYTVLAVLVSLAFACQKEEEPPPVSPPAPAQRTSAAPVVEPAPEAAASVDDKTKPALDRYTIDKGDTLYSIATKNGLDYRDLAKWNNIEDPDKIGVGQVLRLTAPGS